MKASALEVISAVSLYVGGALSLGFLLSWYFLRGRDGLKSLFGSFALGLSTLYVLVLFQLSLTAITAVLVVSLVVAVSLVVWRRRQRRFQMSYVAYGYYGLFVGISIFASWAILERMFYEPVYQWDARIVWYLHAKQLFFSHGLTADTGIVFPNSQGVYHPGYPLLMPAISAYIAHYVGFWNDYIPKANLFVLFLGLLIAMLSARPIHWVWKTITVILMVGFNPYMMSVGYNPLFLTIGYMDGWLAIYAGLCLMFLAFYVRYGTREYLFNAIATGLLLPSIKNEGALLVLIIFGSYVVGLLLFNLRDKRFIQFHLKTWFRFWPVAVLGVLPLIVWSQYKSRWNAQIKDYDFSRLKQVDAYGEIFSDEKLALIDASYTDKVFLANYWYLYLILAAATIIYCWVSGLSVKNWRRLGQEMTLSLTSGLIFVGLMIVVYCLSVHDLAWHLSTSADRLGLHSYYLFGIGMLTMISQLHHKAYRPARDDDAAPPIKKRAPSSQALAGSVSTPPATATANRRDVERKVSTKKQKR
jgi:hypothetical protein